MRRGKRIWEIRKESGGNESKGIKRVEERTHKRKEKEYKTSGEGKRGPKRGKEIGRYIRRHTKGP